MAWFRQVWWLFQKDIRLEWRRRERIATMFFFVVVALGIFGLALEVDPSIQREVLPGILWTILAFAGTLGMGQLYASETEDAAVEGLRVAPIAREAIFLAKQLALFVFLLVCAVGAVPLGTLMFQVDLGLLLPKAVPIFFLGLWGFAILGTLMATLLLQSQFREALLPLMFLPVALPILIVGARATAELSGTGGLPHTEFWIRGLLVFDLVFFVLGLWLFSSQFER